MAMGVDFFALAAGAVHRCLSHRIIVTILSPDLVHDRWRFVQA